VDGAITTANVMTGNFTATPDGNAHIVQRLSLPHPCIAPIVMVTAPDVPPGLPSAGPDPPRRAQIAVTAKAWL
jgi:hypothetical protein